MKTHELWSSKAANLETQNGSKATNYKSQTMTFWTRWTVEVNFCLLSGPLKWLTAAKNATILIDVAEKPKIQRRLWHRSSSHRRFLLSEVTYYKEFCQILSNSKVYILRYRQAIEEKTSLDITD